MAYWANPLVSRDASRSIFNVERIVGLGGARIWFESLATGADLHDENRFQSVDMAAKNEQTLTKVFDEPVSMSNSYEVWPIETDAE